MRYSCPKCGGENQLEIVENEYLKCSYCNSSLYIDLDGLTLVYSYKSLINSQNLSLHLKKDFEKTGFSENFKIINSYPLYLPFWETEAKKQLERGNSRFADEFINIPSEEKKTFDFEEAAGEIEVLEPDTQPESGKKRNLCYMPYYAVVINYKDKEYTFYINGINGVVTGDPIPYVSSDETIKLLPLFLLIFAAAFIVNYFFDNLIIALIINIITVFILYNLSLKKINKKLYSK
ncbi:MAG: hypothetical protein ABFR75_07735 [Acidobacteriota bacterium]